VAAAANRSPGATGCDVELVSVETGRLIGTCRNHSDEVTTVQFNSDGRLLICGCIDGSIWLWDYVEFEQPYVVLSEGFARAQFDTRVLDFAVSPLADKLISCSDGVHVKMWDMAEGAQNRLDRKGRTRQEAEIITTKQLGYVWTPPIVELGEEEDEAAVAEKEKKRKAAKAEARNAERAKQEARAKAAGAEGGAPPEEEESENEEDIELRAATSDFTATSQASHSIVDVAFSEDGSTLVKKGMRPTTAPPKAPGSSTVSLTNPLALEAYHSGKVLCVAWSQDSVHMASGSDDNTARIWNASDRLVRARASARASPRKQSCPAPLAAARAEPAQHP
jgi:WD40 repeat protein